jgi:O-acetyl-ADP-ribose deacetylase (regulator of RNase III)
LTILDLDAYGTEIALDVPFAPSAPPAAPDGFEELVRTALGQLVDEASAAPLGLSRGQANALPAIRARRALRAVLNRRPPAPLPEGVNEVLDALLGGERGSRVAVDPRTIAPAAGTALSLWQGDLTTLAADAIVNAANSAMLGCFQPLHSCVDNAIHSSAGPQMRLDCAAIMAAQGLAEPPGTPKITRGYHLPAGFVIHTVGPIVKGAPSAADRRALADSYTACLDLAARVAPIRTLAFCAISTGVFGYPRDSAAQVALEAINAWLLRHRERFDRVICCAYADDDAAAYRHALHKEK